MPELKFEEALKKLEAIVEGLEQGKISLEDSLKKYEEGIRLAKFCTEKLQEAEKKIEILTKDNSGKIKREPFKVKEEENPSEPEEKKQKEGFLF
jgi:exodeoxyribonuclease VII small subunit